MKLQINQSIIKYLKVMREFIVQNNFLKLDRLLYFVLKTLFVIFSFRTKGLAAGSYIPSSEHIFQYVSVFRPKYRPHRQSRFVFSSPRRRSPVSYTDEWSFSELQLLEGDAVDDLLNKTFEYILFKLSMTLHK